MYFSTLPLLGLMLAAKVVTAIPHPNNPIASAICKLDNAIINIMTAQPQKAEVLAFCSSYIKLPAVTTTTTKTTTQTASLTVATVTPLTTVTIAPAIVPRAASNPIPTPGCLKKFAAPLISQACSCISSQIPLSTTTVQASATTTYTADETATAATVTSTCSVSPLINGGFESGFASWTKSTLAQPTASASIFIRSNPSNPGSAYAGHNAAYASCIGPTTSSDGFSGADELDYSKASLTQTLNTCVGVTYDVTLAYNIQGYADGNPNNYLIVYADGVSIENVQGSQPDSLGNGEYAYHDVGTDSFVATAAETLLEVQFVCGRGTTMEWLLDAVMVTARSSS